MSPQRTFQPFLIVAATVFSWSALGADTAIKSNNIDQWQDIADDVPPSVLFDKVKAFSDAEAAQNPLPPEAAPFRLNGPFSFPGNAKYDDGNPRLNSIFGLDVSKYTPSDLPIKELKHNYVTFLYMKATQGVGYKDPKFHDFWTRVEDYNKTVPVGLKLYRGAYHFLSSSAPGNEQAKSFVRFVKLNNGFQSTDELPPVLDLEWDISSPNGPDRWEGQTPRQIIEKALDCLSTMQAQMRGLGFPRKPILYTSRAWMQDRGITKTDFDRLGEFQVWIADYSQSHRAVEHPAQIYGASNLIWQFASDAHFPGFATGLDVDIYYGDQAQFKHDFQIR